MENNETASTTPETKKELDAKWLEILEMEKRVIDLLANSEKISNQVTPVDTFYKDFFDKGDGTIKSKAETVFDHHNNIEQHLKGATDLKKNLEDFTVFINGSDGTTGFKKDLEDQLTKNKEANNKLNSEWALTYETLTAKIEGLLPGATATGLSMAYQQQKASFNKMVTTWAFVFVAAIVGMLTFGIITYASVKDLSDSFMHILMRLPFFAPAIWLAWFAGKQMSRYQRLQQDYIYKETLSKSYESYKREIDLLPESTRKTELQEKLISAMVEMCSYNPSVTLDSAYHNKNSPTSFDSLTEAIKVAISSTKPT